MKKLYTYTIFMVALMSLSAIHSFGQCDRVALIGEFNGWAEDLILTRNTENPAVFEMYTQFTEADDEDKNDTIHMKFRVVGDWGNNWGNNTFPSGTAVADGPNIPVLPFDGNYYVSFNCETGDYNFEKVSGVPALIGEFNGWADDLVFERSSTNHNSFSTIANLNAGGDSDGNDTIELKFRFNKDWAINAGNSGFPTDTAVLNGPNIPVHPIQSYKVEYNVSADLSFATYNFTPTCNEVSLIGEFNGWGDDHFMTRDPNNPDMWETVILLDPSTDDGNDTIELKFRAGSDWGTNWGGDGWPSGTATLNGANIKAPLDGAPVAKAYKVSFNCSTGDYTFESTCGPVSMIGAFVNWNGDAEMSRDATNPNMWSLTRSWHTDSEVKFRENKDWSVNWGDGTWPSGTATDNGSNIPLVAGTYDVSFNCSTGAYNFTDNADVCGEIGMVGDFNNWGAPDDPANPPTDVNLVRDPNSPSQFSITYNFTNSTNLLFRENADPSFSNVWGGTFPEGTGVKDPSKFIAVTGGSYKITFNCKSGDFKFVRLGSTVNAPKVFAIDVDGQLDEKDWKIDQNVSKIVDGEAGNNGNSVSFGVTYNDEYLFIAATVTDGEVATGSTPGESDAVHIYIDGDKSGGDYDDSDVHFMVDASGTITVAKGPAGISPDAKFTTTGTGYVVEASVAWADLGVTPVEGAQIGFDLGVSDNDEGEYQSLMMWNGGTSNADATSTFGDLLFGSLSCGGISLYNDNIGDVQLHSLTEAANTYVGTYEFESDMAVVFRKDNSSSVQWGADAFPAGSATVGGDAIPVTAGRYRVAFGCLDGAYSFVEEVAGAGVAFAQFTDQTVTIDGNLDEYTLSYGMTAGIVDGSGTPNDVAWGMRWDSKNLYLAVEVGDDVVEGSGNPWDNDAIEIYIDGNHDSDGTFDGDFDSQIIMDFAGGDAVWVKADGVPIPDIEGKWLETSSGYNIEMRIGWNNFGFVAAKNRTMGFTIGNNDSDNGTGRDHQSAWFGTADNWNNTSVHGDIQLAGGSLIKVQDVDYSNNISVFPNPSMAGNGLYILSDGKVFNGETKALIFNMNGELVEDQKLQFNGSPIQRINNNFGAGQYIIYLISKDGKEALQKVIIE